MVRLHCAASDVEVLVAPGLGNRAYAMSMRDSNILYMPARTVADLKELSGIPFLAPWANRIPGGGFHANGKWFAFNESLGVFRMHPEHVAIHGLLTASALWQVTELGSDAESAWVTSHLEFWRYPDLMANWPFAHEYEMTYRLAGSELETSVRVRNLSAEPMPVSIGFHPFFTIPGVPRDEWTAHIPARSAVVADERLCATGEFRPNVLPSAIPLSSHTFDDGFTDLTEDPFWVEGSGRRIEVAFGPKWQVGVVYAPSGRDFICFEPMAAITNGVNLAAAGRYAALQTVEPGGVWTESFRVRAIGFGN